MKTKLFAIICLLAVSLGGVNTARASEDNSIFVVGDVVLARPGCLLATVLGSAVFVISLPIAVTSGSVHATADTLVAKPAAATFTRPLGDFTSLE